jgi:HlyD family secretion protein
MDEGSPVSESPPDAPPSRPSLRRGEGPLPVPLPLPPPITPDEPRQARSRWLAGLAIVALAALALGAWHWRAAFEPWVGLTPPPATLMVSGNVEAHESVLAFKTVQSRILELPFDEGQWVKTGTLIARVDDADYHQQVAIAEAALAVQQRQLATAEQNLEAARKTVTSDQADVAMKKLDYERYQELWSHGNVVSTQTRDQAATAYKQSLAALERDQALALAAERNIDLAKANIESAEASLTMAKIVLGYTTLTAPFDGVILVRQAELGEIAVPGTPVVTLADLDHVWVRAYINETDIARVRFGADVAVTTDTYPGKTYKGRVSFISSSAEFTPKTVETHAERVTLVYRIKIDVDNPTHELVPGMPADGAIQLPAP